MTLGLVGILVLLNALSYVQTQKEPDSELRPNRSSYNPGATGTQAFYTLLLETGRKPVRWQDSPEGLATARNKPDVFVVIGSVRREFSEKDIADLLRWVSQGGKLVLIDREPPKELCVTTSDWKIGITNDPAASMVRVDPADQQQMTSDTKAAKPVQPSRYTVAVNAVQPSRFAGWITFRRMNIDEFEEEIDGSPFSTGYQRSGLVEFRAQEPIPPPPVAKADPGETSGEPQQDAPVVHLTGNEKNLLVDAPYGQGKIVYLADPYVVSNSGIAIVDNSQLAINLVAGAGPIAFDEYHQGYGANANRLFQYFEGTPVIAIFAQVSFMIGLLFLSQSRRFGRPLPEPDPGRASKLEYVAAMAELQQRTRAYDLAMENIYLDFRRRITRSLGLNNLTSTRREVAEAISERTTMSARDVEQLMAKCESIIHGEPTNKNETLTLTEQLREIEDRLSIKRTPKGTTR